MQPVLRPGARIWVAGCGTNQALYTALKFPQAKVTGSDLSADSLIVCSANAQSLGVGNLELRNESINGAEYESAFDLVICTGVIHHNADPVAALSKLARALKPTGVMELMVYNRYHRILTASFQNALWTFLGKPAKPDLSRELPVARKFVTTFREESLMAAFLTPLADATDASFADTLLQPVEHSYTVETLGQAAAACNLEMVGFCNDAFSRAHGEVDWNLHLQDHDLAGIYAALPDMDRWQMTNLMLAERSPMLWFYLRHRDCPQRRKTEQEICEEILNQRLIRVTTEREIYFRRADGTYADRPLRAPFPGEPRDPLAKRVVSALDESAPFKETLRRLGVDMTFPQINRLRTSLATSGCPFLEVAPET
jgi:SAM-dependent methyltransferase